MAKMKPKWEYGVFVGVRQKSGEVWAVTKEGKVEAARSVRRIPMEDRWGKDNWRWIKGAPWHMYRGTGYQEGDMPEGVEAK